MTRDGLLNDSVKRGCAVTSCALCKLLQTSQLRVGAVSVLRACGLPIGALPCCRNPAGRAPAPYRCCRLLSLAGS